MLDVGWGEILLVLVLALVFIGPKELPLVAHKIGCWVGAVKRMMHRFTLAMEQSVHAEQARAHNEKILSEEKEKERKESAPHEG